MDPKFVESDLDLLPVVGAATDHELSILTSMLRRAWGCWLGDGCQDPVEIANEFQLLGGNSIANKLRGHGVKYVEILSDVAKEIGARVKGGADIAEAEWLLVLEVIAKARKKLKAKQKVAFEKELERIVGGRPGRPVWVTLRNDEITPRLHHQIIKLVLAHVVEAMDLAEKSQFYVYLVTGASVTVAPASGPLGAAITGAIAALLAGIFRGIWNLPGPAFSATIPAVFLVACIRSRLASKTTGITEEPEAERRGDLSPAVAGASSTAPSRKAAPVSRTAPSQGNETERKIVKLLLDPPKLWAPEDLLAGTPEVPRKKGVYAWYFDALPGCLHDGDYLHVDWWTVLYVGVAGQDTSSKATLHSRIIEKHLGNNADMSTLRKSLGCLLRQKLGLIPEMKGNEHARSFWWGRSGERRLTDWITEHASIAWVLDDEPWKLEKAVLELYGRTLPLNIRKNRANRFRQLLERLRTAAKNEAW